MNCWKHQYNEAQECERCELDRVKALLRRCAVELSYYVDMCPTPVANECLYDTERELGVMRHWPEIS